jgi:hypothetical protein
LYFRDICKRIGMFQTRLFFHLKNASLKVVLHHIHDHNMFMYRIQITVYLCCVYNTNIVFSNMMSFFRFVSKHAIYRLGIISLAHAPVHMTGFPVVNVHVDELSSARIWQHKLCATLSANVNIYYSLPIKVYYRICTLLDISESK